MSSTRRRPVPVDTGMSFSQLAALLKSDNESLVVAVQGSRIAERGCKNSGLELDQAVQIVRDGTSKYALRGLTDPDGNFEIDFTVDTLKNAVQTAVDEVRDKFADLPRETSKYAVYYRGEECNKEDIFKTQSALEKKANVGTLLGEPKPAQTAAQKSFFDAIPKIGTQMRELYTLHSADADNKLLVTLRANLPTTGPPTCDFDESLQTVQVVPGSKSGSSAETLAKALLAAAKVVSNKAGGADADDMVVLFKPDKRCAFVALGSAELDYVEPLKRILTSDESLAKNQIRLDPMADPKKLKNAPGNNAMAKREENQRRKEELFTPSGTGAGNGAGNNNNNNGSGTATGNANGVAEQPEGSLKKENKNEEGGLSKIAIFGIVGGVLFAIVLVLVFLIFKNREPPQLERPTFVQYPGASRAPLPQPLSPLPQPLSQTGDPRQRLLPVPGPFQRQQSASSFY